MVPRLALVPALLIMFGCRDSAKPPARAPVVSPAFTAQAQRPAGPEVVVVHRAKPGAVPPPMSAMVPIKTIPIELPASFSAEQLPRRPIEFQIQANADAVLAVKTAEIYRVLVRPLAGGTAPKSGGDSAGNWFFAFPETGTYRILYAPVENPAIDFRFLAADDPMADPGIRRGQISIDFGPFAQKSELNVAPYAYDDEADYMNSWPTHLALEGDRFEFRIMTVAGHKRIYKENQRIDALAAAMRSGGRAVDPKKLPYSVYGDAGLNLATRPVSMEGDGWRGLRWVGGFAQDVNCDLEGQQLVYVFEGLSSDGLYFIMLRAAVSHPSLPPHSGPDCVRAAEGDLTSAMPDSFRPNIEQLDAVIRSLKIRSADR